MTTKSQPSQMSMFGAFAEAEFDAKTAHMPSTMETAIPFYRSIIERYHTAMLAGQPTVAAAIQLEAEALAVRLNGGTNFGMKGNPETAVCCVLERYTTARDGGVPLWGQTGEFTIDVGNCPVRIEFEGLYGLCIPQFSTQALEYDKPFISETGYRSFMAHGFDCSAKNITVDLYVRTAIEQYIAGELKGKLVRIRAADQALRTGRNERGAW